LLEQRWLLACPGSVCLVTNTDDSGAGSLRQAILDANLGPASLDRIEFAIPGVGPHTITPTSPLPVIVDSIEIDGSTQPEFVAGFPVIELDGSSAGNVFGLSHTGVSDSLIRGLLINRFQGDGILLNASPRRRSSRTSSLITVCRALISLPDPTSPLSWVT
jgi:hypothetical protein